MPFDRTFWSTPHAFRRLVAARLVYLTMRLVVLLPLAVQLKGAKRLGRVLRRLSRWRRRVVERNLEVCFPQLSAAQRNALSIAHFEAVGASFVETAMGWFGAPSTVRKMIRVDGLEHLSAAIAAGRGTILYAAHFTSFELYWPALAPLCPRLSGMYKTQRNPLMDEVARVGRGHSYDCLFDRENVRAMLRELASNAVVWYASDQSHAGKGGVLVPFFDEPAMTNTAINRIATISGATVLPYFCRRLPDDSAYEMTIGAPLAGFPSDDPAADARHFVALLEAYVRRCPEQYWWVHRRFKGRPAPYPDIYARPAEFAP